LRSEILNETIIDIISEIIKVDSAEIAQDPSSFGLGETDGWDSLVHLEIMTALEEEYDIELSIEDMEATDTAEKILRYFET
tara:strand:- start:341 stop:583 length:243 start_codon:yes stop_codon:yes gene_type:complete